MPWVRYDDQASIHRKVAPLSDPAYRLWREATEWSSRNGTDGRIRTEDLAEISKRGKPKNAAELVKRELWHPAGTDCPHEQCPPAGPDGWVIHDYWDFQPTSEAVKRERAAKAERQKRWRDARRNRNGTRDADVDALRDGGGDAPVTPAPYPSRPAPKEAGRGDPPRAAPAAATAATAGGGGRDNQPSVTQRLSGSPDYDAIQQRATQGPRRDALAAAARAALNRTQETPDA